MAKCKKKQKTHESETKMNKLCMCYITRYKINWIAFISLPYTWFDHL